MRPYSTASEADRILSRSMSLRTCSGVRPECLAQVSSSQVRIRRTSLAWISMSDACPPMPPSSAGWWIRIRAFGRAKRLPLAPADRSTAAAEAAWPMTKVCTSGRMYCIVS